MNWYVFWLVIKLGLVFAQPESPFDSDLSSGCDELGLSLSSESSGSGEEAGLSMDELSSEQSNGESSTLDADTWDLEVVRAKPLTPRSTNSYLYSEVCNGKVMKRKALSVLSIKSVLREKCVCGEECIKKLGFKQVRLLRESFWSNSKTMRMQLLKYYISHSQCCGRFRFLTTNCGIKLCSKGFQVVLRINKNTFSRALDIYRRTAATIPGRKPRDLSDQTLLLIIWFEDYATFHGDRMPDSETVLLPYKTRKFSLYLRYKTEMPDNAVSRAQFFKIWNDRFPHLKIKQSNSFSKCTTCTTLERQLEKTTDPLTRATYRKMKDEHNDRQMLERKYYYSKREASRKAPSEFMSLIVDGMDQSKTNLPHFAGRSAKNVNAADLFKTHVTGVINHGHGGFHSYIDIKDYPHDPNLTINVILMTLKKTAERQAFLPPTLYIQADNCYRENKNRFVMGFCELLVQERIFNEVHLSLLQVGHTHEDVDAAFSKVADNLRKNDAETIADLLSLVPNSEMIRFMFDVRNWLIPTLNTVIKISEPHHFKFTKKDDKIEITFKGHQCDTWTALEGSLFNKYPTGTPTLLQPNYEELKDGRQLKQCETLKNMFLKSNSLDSWKTFYQYIEEGKRVPPLNIKWTLEDLPRQIDSEPVDLNIPQEITTAINKETRAPQVRIQKKKQAKPHVAHTSNSQKNKKGEILIDFD